MEIPGQDLSNLREQIVALLLEVALMISVIIVNGMTRTFTTI